MKEVRTLEGQLSGRGLRIGIVAARFNEAVVERLIAGALDALTRHGSASEDMRLVRVPGAFEIPLAAKVMAESGEHDAIVCVGALIRGETPHFDVLASQVTASLGQVQLATGVPIALGILTCNTAEQAMDRAGLKSGNKDFEAAVAAIEMAGLLRELKGDRSRGKRRDRT